MMRRFSLGLLLAVSALNLVGCASTGEHPTKSGFSTGASGSVPAFSGPYAAEFADAYRKAKSDTVRRTLAKGTITEQDRATAWEQYRSCMAAAGFTVKEEDGQVMSRPTVEDGKTTGDQDNAADIRCDEESSFGWLNILYQSLTKYPQGMGQRKAVFVECLQRAKAVQPGYSVEDLDRDSKQGGAWDPRNDTGRDANGPSGRFRAYQRCSSDPSQ